MNLLATWEELLGRFIIDPLQRRLDIPLDQADLAKHLGRAMQDESQIFPGKLVGPNLYEVELSSEDADRFRSHQKILLQDLSDYLIDLAARRNIIMLGRPEIRLFASKEMGRGQIKIRAKLVDVFRGEPTLLF